MGVLPLDHVMKYLAKAIMTAFPLQYEFHIYCFSFYFLTVPSRLDVQLDCYSVQTKQKGDWC